MPTNSTTTPTWRHFTWSCSYLLPLNPIILGMPDSRTRDRNGSTPPQYIHHVVVSTTLTHYTYNYNYTVTLKLRMSELTLYLHLCLGLLPSLRGALIATLIVVQSSLHYVGFNYHFIIFSHYSLDFSL